MIQLGDAIACDSNGNSHKSLSLVINQYRNSRKRTSNRASTMTSSLATISACMASNIDSIGTSHNDGPSMTNHSVNFDSRKKSKIMG